MQGCATDTQMKSLFEDDYGTVRTLESVVGKIENAYR